jgi:hypothetical protein
MELNRSQVESIRQFIEAKGLEGKLICFVSKADREDIKKWLCFVEE